MTSMTMLACSDCWNPIPDGSPVVHLDDLAFHEGCSPRCRACSARLAERDEQRWSYEGRVVWGAAGYHVRPTELWCDACRELHDRDLAFAQD